jgi:hypothetical protein
MRPFTTLALTLSLLAVPAAASACGMEIDIDRKHTLVAAKADAPTLEKASVLKALLAEVDAKMEAEVVTAPAIDPDVPAPNVDVAPAKITAKKVARR